MYSEKRENGSAMVFTLFALTLLAIASTTTYLSVTNSVRSSETRLRALQAMYAAESGLEATIFLLNQDSGLIPERQYPDDAPSLNTMDQSFPEVKLLPGDGLAYRTWFDGSVVVAEGTSGGISQRIEVNLDQDTSTLVFEHAVACLGSIDVGPNASVSGDLRTELVEDWESDPNDPFITGPSTGDLQGGEITVGANGDPDETISGFADVPKNSSPDQVIYPEIPVPEHLLITNPPALSLSSKVTRTISEDSTFSSLNISGQADLVFDTSQDPLYVYVEGDIASSGLGEISITGPNPLYLFVGGSVDMSGQFSADDDSTKFVLVGVDTSRDGKIKITGQAGGSSVIYAPSYNVEIKGQGNQTGAIIAGSATFTGQGRFTYDKDLADLELINIQVSESTYLISSGSWQKL